MQDYKIYAAMAYARANRLNRITHRFAQRAAGHRRVGQVLHGRARSAGRAGHLGAQRRRRSASACSRSRCPGRWSRTACASSRAGWRRSWWSRKSARSSSTSSRSSCTTGTPTCARASSASSTRRANGSHPRGEWLLPAKGDFSIAQIARVIAGRVARFHPSDLIKARLTFLEAKEAVLKQGGEHAAATGLLLLGLPAQQLHQSAGRQPRAGRHRLPRDGDRHLSRAQQDHHPDGRRRRDVDRPGHRSPSCRMSSPTSATAPISIPATSRSAPRWRRTSTSPTRSSTTMPWR